MSGNSPAPEDLRSWIELLRQEGELVDVHTEVDPYLEITEIVDRIVKTGGPALLFHHPKGSSHPLLINQFGSDRRMQLAFGEANLAAVARKLEGVLWGVPPTGGTLENIRSFGATRRLMDSTPKVVSRAPCQEIVLDEPNLDLLPIQTCWPGDAAPFITLPAVITRDPRSGVRNVGIYRMQKIDSKSTLMHWQLHKDAAASWRSSELRLDVAVAIGCDPITTYMASAPLPAHVDELMLAGFLRGSPLELVKAKTVDLEVPANAEIVLEGFVQRDELATEGPFGDHTGYYSPPEPFPIFHLTCMTMRKGAIYPSIVVGPPPAEDAYLGKASERIWLPALRMSIPEIVNYDLPVGGAFQNCAIVSIRKEFPGQARKVMYALWGLGSLSLLKSIVVVDEFIDVHDYGTVFFHVCANVDPKRDVFVIEGALDQLDHSASMHCYGGKLGIDATHKLPAEVGREWPRRITMSPDIRQLVDSRWPEYSLDPQRRMIDEAGTSRLF
jgi:4-hydroxy-3-polyprenylbenzoate decarboxylase